MPRVLLLAAGRSFRMAPVRDKNFLKFFGRPLIEHQIQSLKAAGFKEILIIGGRHNLSSLKKLGCRVIEQKNLELGMAGALLAAKTKIGSEPFVLVSANDVIEPSAYESFRLAIKKNQGGKNPGLLLAKKSNEYFPGGYLKITPQGLIKEIVEKPKEGKQPSKLVNIVLHYHPQPKILFEALFDVIASERKRAQQSGTDNLYELALQKIFDKGIKYFAVPYNGFWQPVKYPWHVLSLGNHFLGNLKSHRGAAISIAKSAKIYGNVHIEGGVKILDNAVIQGPSYIGKNTIIGTNALVRQSHIGENSVIGFSCEIARSFIGDNSWFHSNYIGDSIIGSDVAFGSGTVTGNFRLDEKTIKAAVSKTWNGKTEIQKIDTALAKLGLITGDHIRVGINTSFMPGVKVGLGSFIGAGLVIACDVPDNMFVTGKWELKMALNNEKIKPLGRAEARLSN